MSTIPTDLAQSIEASKEETKIDLGENSPPWDAGTGKYIPGSAWSPHATSPTMKEPLPPGLPVPSQTAEAPKRRRRATQLAPEVQHAVQIEEPIRNDVTEDPEALVESTLATLRASRQEIVQKIDVALETHRRLSEKLNRLEEILEAFEAKPLGFITEEYTPQEQADIELKVKRARKYRVVKIKKARKPAKLANHEVVAALNKGWTTMSNLAKLTGWKSSSLYPQLSILGKKVEKRPAPTKKNPRQMEYRM